MPFKQHCMGSGMSAAAASSAVGGGNLTITAAGTTQANATLLPMSSLCYVATAANNSGVIIPPGNGSGDLIATGDWFLVYNADANNLLLYPPLGGALNNGTTNASLTIATKTSLMMFSVDGKNFVASGPNT
jgi:hypothetical protein